MRLLRLLHDLALCLLLGGVAGTALCAGVLFDRAPTREIAGQIGSAIFGRLGPSVLVLTLVVLGSKLLLPRSGGAWRLPMIMACGMTAVALVIALWLTPRMISIWNEAPHAQDGSGLLGEDRRRFFMLHGMTNVGYVAIAILSAIQVALGSRGGREGVARPHRGE